METKKNDYLEHHGILGMHWGVRRYQNKDGTLTSAGKKRYLNSDGTLNIEGVETFRKKGNELKEKINASKNYTNRTQAIIDDEKRSKDLEKEKDSLYEELYEQGHNTDWLKDDYDPDKLKRYEELSAWSTKNTHQFISKYNEASLKDIEYENIEVGKMYLEASDNSWKLKV